MLSLWRPWVVLTWFSNLLCVAEAIWRLKIHDHQEQGGMAQSSPYPDRPGAPDCGYYLRTGLCGYGSNCRFNHPVYAALVICVVTLEVVILSSAHICGFSGTKQAWFIFHLMCISSTFDLDFSLYFVVLILLFSVQGAQLREELPERVGQPDCGVNSSPLCLMKKSSPHFEHHVIDDHGNFP